MWTQGLREETSVVLILCQYREENRLDLPGNDRDRPENCRPIRKRASCVRSFVRLRIYFDVVERPELIVEPELDF